MNKPKEVPKEKVFKIQQDKPLGQRFETFQEEAPIEEEEEKEETPKIEEQKKSKKK